jgi:DNA (cytosine-5)-methyltransferase 1
MPSTESVGLNRLFGPSFAASVTRDAGHLVRKVEVGDRCTTTVLEITDPSSVSDDDLTAAWFLERLRGAPVVDRNCSGPEIEVGLVDLFCASGGFTQGIRLVAEELGVRLHTIAGVDIDDGALEVYTSNHSPELSLACSVDELVDFRLDLLRDGTVAYLDRPRSLHKELSQLSNQVDLVIGGPPCQGHSNLNNYTRRDDPRNLLYALAPAIAEMTGASTLLIENVPGVVNDRGQIVQTSESLLQSERWTVEQRTLDASNLGWPQTRKRHFLCAHRTNFATDYLTLEECESALQMPARPVSWIFDDLLDASHDSAFTSPSELSEDNQARIRTLFENDLYDLPDEFGPPSRQGEEPNRYTAVYGRMHWDKPAGTITTGFLTPGRGRYTHPTQPRGLTPHEGARIQGFPDSYDFQPGDSPPSRTDLAKWIGDAVPIPLGYAAGLAALSRFVLKAK